MRDLFLIAVLVAVCCFSTTISRRQEGPMGENHIFDLRVYRIESRYNDKVLTANHSRPEYPWSYRTIVATTAPWTDDASQKWRLDRAALYSSFELHPTSNENYDLEYDESGNFFNWIGSWGFGNNKLWYLVDAGNGYHMIKNQYNEICIRAHESNEPLSADKCENAIAQQWKFVFLSGK